MYFNVTFVIWERLLALGAMSFVAEFHQRRWTEQTFSIYFNFLQHAEGAEPLKIASIKSAENFGQLVLREVYLMSRFASVLYLSFLNTNAGEPLQPPKFNIIPEKEPP